ncbi:hypothetical protein SKAU_G00044100 [Synaphobranchus kaupii]|uniref:PPM-type phosphatase domain-containing protein n=1 Tax=Synaphobranchus kaupii TaxID=118154 RepID=A0A9Q1J937_SYNKA|nr:hypothetical protein SKAU_G00044100 [Synaphobranchus kaupii]
MDTQIEREKSVYNISGGCTALVVVFLLGKLYVGNAGDSRAIIIRNGEVIPMSTEFTPESERQRLQFLGYMQPHLLGNEFTHLEFPRRVQRKEVGKRMLYRDFTMTGWRGEKREEVLALPPHGVTAMETDNQAEPMNRVAACARESCSERRAAPSRGRVTGRYRMTDGLSFAGVFRAGEPGTEPARDGVSGPGRVHAASS